MSQSTILELLPETAYSSPTAQAYTVTGNAQPAAGYYLGNRDLQTVNFKLTNCTGNVVIQATLNSNVASADWFTVYEFQASSSNVSTYTNIDGNFVYLRAKIEDLSSGVVNFVKLGY